MKLLAFETTTEACSVAVLADGAVIERFEVAPRRHAELALPWADDLLAQAGIARSQLDAIAVGRGPGAFTGVRLGIALAQGIALALDVPVVPVSTLATLALRAADDGAPGEQRILALIDARMGEVYAGCFLARDGELSALSGEAVVAPGEVELPGHHGDWIAVGTGLSAAEGAIAIGLAPRLRRADASALPRAADTARLAARLYADGAAVAPEAVEPAYLRNNVALTLAQQAARRAGG